MQCFCLTSQDADLLSRGLTQKVLDEVVSHRKDFRGCDRKSRNLSIGRSAKFVVLKKYEITFDNKQFLQPFWIVVFKHLEDLVQQRNISTNFSSALSAFTLRAYKSIPLHMFL